MITCSGEKVKNYKTSYTLPSGSRVQKEKHEDGEEKKSFTTIPTAVILNLAEETPSDDTADDV